MNLDVDKPQTRFVNRKALNLIPWQPLTSRDFRLLWIGQSVSLLGDQIYLVALPLLTLQLNGSGFALGTVLMATTIPRALFQLVGGALSDQFSPHRLILISNAGRALLIAILTTEIMLGTIKFWHLYPLAIGLGLADAFFYPAFKSLVALIMDEHKLAASNALLQLSTQSSKFIGPLLASLVILTTGFGAAFALDTLSFIFAILLLLMMRGEAAWLPAQEEAGTDEREARTSKPGGLMDSIRKGLSYAWGDPIIRNILVLTTILEFSFAGPLFVGLPTLVKERFAGSPTAFGAMLSTFGASMLVGTLLAPAITKLRYRFLIIVGISCAFGIGLSLMGFVKNVPSGCVLLGFMGLGAGILQILTLTWLQTRAPANMRGRVISIFTFAGYVLTPLSYAIAGAVVDLNLALTFVVAGGLMTVTALGALGSRTVRAPS
ncbi:MAG TPA: MFS transporter [Pyrinomonadaceae bacterium]|jgi:MFS family permease